MLNPYARTFGAPEPVTQPGERPVISPAPDPIESKLAQALIARQMQALPQSRSWQEAVGNALPMYGAQFRQSRMDDESKAHNKSLAEAFSGSPDQFPDIMIKSGDPDLMRQGITAKMQLAQQRAAAEAKANAPLRGKERLMSTPGGIFDIETMQMIPGTEKEAARRAFKVGDAIVEQGPDGKWAPVYQGQGGGGAKPPTGYRYSQDEQTLEAIPGGPADPAVKPKGRDKFTDSQTKAANFGNMMVKADKALAETAEIGPDGKPLPIENPKNFLGATRDSLVPFAGLRNKMTPNETQEYNQVAEQWIRAKLRKESGAVIGEEEMNQEFRTFFPQYGDGPDVIARKAAAREEAVRGMLAESGGAYQQLFPEQGAPAPAQPSPTPQGNPNDPLGILD